MDKKRKQSGKNKLKITSEAQGLFDWWNTKATIRQGDSFKTKLSKVGIRILGIILMMIFSPIIIAIFIMVIAISL